MRTDLVCLVADKDIEAVIQELLRERTRALGIRAVVFETLVHPRRDPGCANEPHHLLRGYGSTAAHALVVLDHAFDGAPPGGASDLEERIERVLAQWFRPEWARAVVIEPELESWVFARSPHVARALGWRDRTPSLREALEGRNLWPEDRSKPPDPKAALEWALRVARRPRSSSIYRELARTVGLNGCQDRALLRLRATLREWFPNEG